MAEGSPADEGDLRGNEARTFCQRFQAFGSDSEGSSVGNSNIAEGFERGGDKEFAQFIALAKGSSAELQSQLCVALDEGYIDQETFERLSKTTLEINRMLTGVMKYLRESNYKGSKFR